MSYPAGCRSCLVLHGLGGGPFELAPVIGALREVGIDVEAPVLPGHEGDGPRMPGSLWTEWAAAVEASYDRLSVRAEGAGAVLGFSTGATLALDLASHRPVDRLILLAPFLAIRFSRWMPIAARHWLGPIARVMPNVPRRPAATVNRAIRRELDRLDLVSNLQPGQHCQRLGLDRACQANRWGDHGSHLDLAGQARHRSRAVGGGLVGRPPGV